MISNNPIDDFIALHVARRASRNLFLKVLRYLNVVLLNFIFFIAITTFHPDGTFFNIASLIIFTMITTLFVKNAKLRYFSKQDLLTYLETNYSQSPLPPSHLDKDKPSDDLLFYWQKVLTKEDNDFKKIENKFLFKASKLSLLLMLILPLTWKITKFDVSTTWKRLDSAYSAVVYSDNIEIIRGDPTQKGSKKINLSTLKTPKLTLVEDNLLRLTISNPFTDDIPTLILRRTINGDIQPFQSFQLTPLRSPKSGKIMQNFHTITFSVKHSTGVYLSRLGSSNRVADIVIEKLPVPEIALSIAVNDFIQPWPDERPLPIRIDTTSINPMRTIKLMISSGGKSNDELVANILNTNQTSLNTVYELYLHPYVDSDRAEIEITGITTDRATPTALQGFSEPIRVTTASAYGRYRETLSYLKEIKNSLDSEKQRGSYKVPLEVLMVAKKASDFADNTPYFDLVDRVTIGNFVGSVNSLNKKSNTLQMAVLSNDIDDFLFEHEMLDDRERDRDFFVAARSLSRLLEKQKSERPIEVEFAIVKIQDFLDKRRNRWTLRLERIDEKIRPINSRSIIQNKPFHKSMNNILNFDKKNSQELALIKLSETVPKYRKWIESLEAAEDQQRKNAAQKINQSLQQKENVLKEIRRQQATVSNQLDKSATKDQKSLKEKWPTTQKLELKLADRTNKLTQQLMTLAPDAAERLEAASEAMQRTVKYGNSGKFNNAESMADLAGRLLNEAQSKARRQRNKASQNTRKRRQRRRTSGDNYYGKALIGGDVNLERTYEVDQRYREAILDEINTNPGTEEEKKILEQYLRRTVR